MEGNAAGQRRHERRAADRSRCPARRHSDSPGFDSAALHSGATRDQYQLTAEVTGAVFCAWLHTWDTALDNGDTAGAAAAVQAIASSHQWAALGTMTGGAWNEFVWQYADRVANGERAVVTEAVKGLDCSASGNAATPPTIA